MPLPSGGAPGRSERAERGRLASGTTKEVLGFIIGFDFNLDFLGFPILVLGFPRISLGFILGFYHDFDLILVRFDFDSILLGK